MAIAFTKASSADDRRSDLDAERLLEGPPAPWLSGSLQTPRLPGATPSRCRAKLHHGSKQAGQTLIVLERNGQTWQAGRPRLAPEGEGADTTTTACDLDQPWVFVFAKQDNLTKKKHKTIKNKKAKIKQ
jgi:hypothetical protein